MFRAAVLLDEYRNVDAESVQAVTDAVTRARAAISDLSRWNPTAFGSAKAISIDYAVMEKTSHAAVGAVACAGPMSAPGMRCWNCRTRMPKAMPRRAQAVC